MRTVAPWVLSLAVLCLFAAPAQAVCPAGPTLVAPANNATVAAGPVTLKWGVSNGAQTYDIWLALDGDPFSSPAATVTAPTIQFTTTAIEPGRVVQWKVVAKANACPDVSSSVRQFTTACPNVVPTLSQPARGRTFALGTNITFNWSAVPGADSYDLKLSPDDGQTWEVFEEFINGTSFTTNDIPVGNWDWEIRANFNGDCDPLYSQPSHFVVTNCNNSAPVISAPANNATVQQPFQLSWSNVGAKTYRIFVLKPGSSTPELYASTTTTSHSIANLPNGAYKFSVLGTFDSCSDLTSAPITVNIGAASCDSPAPQPIAPANGATGVSSPVEFKWSAVPGATGYTLHVAVGDLDFDFYGATTNTTYSRLVPDGVIRWYVVARFTACDEKRSSVSTFTARTSEECTTGAIDITTPAAGATVSSPLQMSWSSTAAVDFYRVWASAGSEPPSIVARTTTPSATLNLIAGGLTLYVEGVRAGCPSILSNKIAVTVQKAANCDNRPGPTLVSPVGTAVDPADVTNPVKLDWNGVPDAIAYRVWLSKLGQPFADLTLTTDTQTELTLEPGRYAWFAVALYGGCDPVPSPTAFFEIARTEDRCTDARPTQVAPQGGATVSSPVTFQWTAVPGAVAYRVLASIDGGTPELLGKTDQTSLTLLLKPGTVHWLVEAVQEECASTFSERRSFVIARAQNCPTTAATPLAPANDSIVKENPVDFSWTPVSGAIRYAVAAEIDGGSPTILGTTEETHLSSKVPPGTIRWRVFAFFPGCDPVASAMFKFTFERPAACVNGRPILLFPQSNSRPQPSPVFLSWTRVPKATGYKVWLSTQGEQPSLAASTTDTKAEIELAPGRYGWYVQATFSSCDPTDSATGEFTVAAPEPCGVPRAPEAQVIGQALSNTPYRVRWSPLPNVSLYEVQEATTADFTNAQTFTTGNLSMKFEHTVSGNPVQYLYRVRGVSDCSDARGAYSDYVGVFVIAPKTSNASTEIGVEGNVVQTVFLPGSEGPRSFVATADKPWLTITPSHGTVPVEGLTLTVTADPSVLALGTNTGTIKVTYGDSSGSVVGHATTTAIFPMSVSLVTPVLPTGKGTPPPDSLIFPIVGHAVGANNSLFESDIRVTNLGASTMQYELYFTQSGVDGTENGSASTIELAPNSTMALDDIVASLFGTGTVSSATGMLEVRPITTTPSSSSNSLMASITESALRQLTTAASSRTYNFTPNGTFGQYIPAIPFADFAGRLSEGGLPNILSLQQVAQSAAYRANFGFAEAAGQPVDLQVRVYDIANTLLATIPISLQAMEHRQLNGMLASNGINDLTDGRVEVQVMNGDGKVTAYVSEVDNLTNDPLLVNAALKGAVTSDRYVVPGMAFIDNGFAFWVSDLRIFNAGGATPATLTFYPQGNPGAAVSRQITLNAGEIEVLDNVVSTLFGMPNGAGGSIAITTPATTSLTATARTYNQTSNGTYGQYIPGVTPAQSAGLGDRALQVLQLEQSSRFRTNVGVAETSGNPVTIEVSAIVPDSLATPVVTIPLAANEFRQISLGEFGLGSDVYNARVTVRVIDGLGRVTAYGSAIDVVTQDPTYVPAQ